MKNRVYVLSLNRVATQSTQDFLIQLGYQCAHWGGTYINPKLGDLFTHDDMKNIILSYSDKFNAFTDIPYNIMYEEFYKIDPKANFIMINRNAYSWMNSLKSLFNNINKKELDIYDQMLFWKYLDTKPLVISEIPDSDYLTVHKRHTESVLDFFKDKTNFLYINLETDNPEEKIKDFLEMSDYEAKFKKIDNFINWKWEERVPTWDD